MPRTTSFQPSPCRRRLGGLVLSVILVSPVSRAQTPMKTDPSTRTKSLGAPPTVADAKRFIEQAESRLLDLWIKAGRASWVAENFITEDTESISAYSDQAVIAGRAQLAR